MNELTDSVGKLIENLATGQEKAEILGLLAQSIGKLSSEAVPPPGFLNLWEVGDAFRIAMAVCDASGRFLYMNTAFSNEIGSTPEEAIGKYEWNVVHSSICEIILETQKLSTLTVKKVYEFVFVTGIPIFDEAHELRYIGITLETEAAHKEMMRSLQMFEHTSTEDRDIESIQEYMIQHLVGNNQEIWAIRKQILRVAPFDVTILITGESGCGKEVIANCIYEASNRKGKPFLKINCTAIPANLLESELFGYESGAFTGANKGGKIGLLEQADHGTLLLDEIGDFPIELQPKLLRFLQYGEIIRIGETVARKLDVRIIAATNCDLPQKIARGQFREDLYYRLNVIPIQVSPLRERPDDIFLIAKYYMNYYCTKYNRTVIMSDEILKLLKGYSWPGNIRELQNVMEYFVICARDDQGLPTETLRNILSSGEHIQEQLLDGDFYILRDNYERSLIQNALMNATSVRQAAFSLGLQSSTMYRKIKKLGIETILPVD